jgi:formylglycine-generating enzyme required for sulfatase activity
MRLLAWLAAAILVTISNWPGCAQTRVALVIGNNAYKNVPALSNPVTDARDIAESLGRLGFAVTALADANYDAMRRGLLDFGRRARGAEMAVVYFAGHGMEVRGENWLIPTDAKLASDTDTENEAVSLHNVMLQVSGAAKLGMVILDACRNNPFAARMQRTSRLRAVARGLSRVEPEDNVLVAYAARDGTTASDGAGRNSPFTTALLKNIERPGVDVRFLFAAVRDDVMAATGRQQQPFIYQSLPQELIYLRAPNQVAGVVPPQATEPMRSGSAEGVAASPPPAMLPPANPCGGVSTVSISSRSVAPMSQAEECKLKPKDVFKECAKCPEMVVLPAGSFTMGSPDGERGRYKDEGSQHTATIAKPFAVGKFDVTVDQFAAFVAATGYDSGGSCETFDGSNWGDTQDRSWRNPGFVQTGSHPVVCVSWNDAIAYVEWLARTTGKEYRLLTEAEWEYAARGQTRPGRYPRYYFGDNEEDLCRYGNVADQTAKRIVQGAGRGTIANCTDGYAYTSPVGSFPPNGFSLYDMMGNVRQWTSDCPHDSDNGAATEGLARTASSLSRESVCGRRQVVRGGAWFNSPQFLRVASRAPSPTAARNYTFGFRVARTLAP